MRFFLILTLLFPALLNAGSFSGAAGTSGSDAISKDSSLFVAWANGNLTPEYGTDVDGTWKTPQKAYGKAVGGSFDIVCLGNGGRITMYFPRPIKNGQGADFAVFENGISNTFLELAFVEVSSDGVNFFRFPNRSEGIAKVGAFGNVDPTTLNGLAGKHRAGYGTPFDLSALPFSPLLDLENIRFVRIVDIIGDGSVKDSEGFPIYDPTPTTGSGGFDLDAIGVIHQNLDQFKVISSAVVAGNFQLSWESNPGSTYRIETSPILSSDSSTWTSSGVIVPSQTTGITTQSVAMTASPRQFWRVVWLDP